MDIIRSYRVKKTLPQTHRKDEKMIMVDQLEIYTNIYE